MTETGLEIEVGTRLVKGVRDLNQGLGLVVVLAVEVEVERRAAVAAVVEAGMEIAIETETAIGTVIVADDRIDAINTSYERHHILHRIDEPIVPGYH